MTTGSKISTAHTEVASGNLVHYQNGGGAARSKFPSRNQQRANSMVKFDL